MSTQVMLTTQFDPSPTGRIARAEDALGKVLTLVGRRLIAAADQANATAARAREDATLQRAADEAEATYQDWVAIGRFVSELHISALTSEA